MRYRAVVVEDEALSRARLLRLLSERPLEIEVMGQAQDGPSALALIRAARPDVVFLDVGLPGMDGFEMLAQLEHQPAVVFTTGHKERALDAFQTFAVDFLLKPIGAEALDKSIEKLRRMGGLNQADMAAAIRRFMESTPTHYVSLIPCKTGDRTLLVKTGEVLFFQSDNKYTSVFTLERQHLIDTPLVELERRLNPRDFIRIHRSTIVNVAWIAEIRRSYGNTVVCLRDAKGRELKVGRSFAESLKSI